jgi:cytochrome P450
MDFGLDLPELQTDPAGTFRALREQCPVHHTDHPGEHYTVSRHADVTEVLRNSDVWTSKFGPGLAMRGGGVLVSSDPPKHTNERLAITKVFRPSVIEQMGPEIGALIDGIVDRFADDGAGDLISLLAMPVPLTVMCWFLGTPEADVEKFRNWVLPMAEGVAYAKGRAEPDVAAAYEAFFAYFGAHVRARQQRLEAGHDVPDDMLTRLLTVERDGQRIGFDDVLGFCQFLLVAGSATTTLLIGNVIHRLLSHPDQMALVRADPALIEAAVEESLRRDAPVHGLFRTNDVPVCLHGVDIPVDSKMLALFASANLDPEVWADPERFDVTRDLAGLRKHYAFGVGIHYCLGAPLARMEAQLAVRAVLERLPNLRATAAPTMVKAQVLNGWETLPVAWDPVR